MAIMISHSNFVHLYQFWFSRTFDRVIFGRSTFQGGSGDNTGPINVTQSEKVWEPLLF